METSNDKIVVIHPTQTVNIIQHPDHKGRGYTLVKLEDEFEMIDVQACNLATKAVSKIYSPIAIVTDARLTPPFMGMIVQKEYLEDELPERLSKLDEEKRDVFAMRIGPEGEYLTSEGKKIYRLTEVFDHIGEDVYHRLIKNVDQIRHGINIPRVYKKGGKISNAIK